MASIHNALARGNWNDALKRALGLTKASAAVERLGETLQPVTDVWSQPEWARLRGEALGGVRATQAAVATEFSMLALVNLATSGRLVVVESLTVLSTAALPVHLEMALDTQLATLAGTVNTAARDRRNPATLQEIVRTGTDLAATVAGQSIDRADVVVGANPAPFTVLPVVLRPGDALVAIGQTVNLALVGNFRFRSRVAFPGEL